MKSLRIAFLAGALALVAVGCNTETVITEKPDGTKITTSSSASPLKDKSITTGGSFTALKIESTGSATSGTPTANIAIGGGCAGIASSPKDDDRPVMGMSWSCGILSSLTSASASSGEIRYIGLKNESAADTQKRLAAMKQIKDGTLCESANPDSASSNENK